MSFSSTTNHSLSSLVSTNLNKTVEEEEATVCDWCGGNAIFSTRDRISLCGECGEGYLEEHRPPAILENQVAVVIYMETSNGCPYCDASVYLPTVTDPRDPEKFSRKTNIEYDKFFIVNPGQYVGLLTVESGERCETCFERGAYSLGHTGTEEEVAAWVKSGSGYLPDDEWAYGRSFSYQELVDEIDDGPLML